MKNFTLKLDKIIDLTHIRIECDRINLVSLSQTYVDDIFKEFSEEITRYMIPSPPKDVRETASFIASSLEGMKDSRELVVAITSKTGEFLGCAGLHVRSQSNTPEFGIWLKKSAHRKGIGKMAIHALYKWAQDNIDFDYAIYPVDVANVPSRRIPESLGGEVFKKTKVTTPSGRVLNEVIYRVFAK